MKPFRHRWFHRALAAAVLSLALPLFAHADGLSFVMEPYPPFVTADKGVPEGPFPEIVQALCDSMKVACRFRLLPWRRAFAMAEMGSVDGIFVFVHTPERERDFYFSDPILRTAYAIFTRKSSTLNFTNPKDLNGYTVAAYGPSGTSRLVEELAKQSTLRMELEMDNNAVLRKLSAGRYPEPAAALINRDAATYLIAKEKFAGIQAAGDVKTLDFVIGLSRKRVTPEQVERINGALRELVKRGAIKAITDKYRVTAAN